ncbi:MAG TPA: CHASE3 domain-containing protein, partial [Treponemataceae bacterium]|nr:CHASE3 domain-containing protein [Treponemataceae bacterium]
MPDKKRVIFVISAFVFALFFSAFAFKVVGQLKQSAENQKHSYDIMHQANVLLSTLMDVEIGQREFLLTGNELELEPTLTLLQNIPTLLEELRGKNILTAAVKHLDAVAPLIAVKLTNISNEIDLRRIIDSLPPFSLATEKESAQLSASIRSELGSFIEVEEKAIEQIDVTFQENLRKSVAVFVLTIIITYVFI